MLQAIVASIKYEIKLLRKLLNSEYAYYSIYIFTVILKHTADYIISKDLNKPVSYFEYPKLLKERNIITEDENILIEMCISISRRKDKLIKEFSKINISKILDILERIEKFIDQALVDTF